MKLLKIIQTILEKTCAALMIIMALASFAQVINRFVFDGSFFWTDEIIIFSMVWLTFMGSALAVSKNSHTRIDFFITLLPETFRKYVVAFGNLVCAVFVAVLVYFSIPVFEMNMSIISPALNWPMSVSYVAIILGSIIMFVFFVMLAIDQIWTSPKKEVSE